MQTEADSEQPIISDQLPDSRTPVRRPVAARSCCAKLHYSPAGFSTHSVRGLCTRRDDDLGSAATTREAIAVATGPTILTRTFPQLLAAGRLEAHKGGEGGALYDATLTLFAAFIDGRSRLATARSSSVTDLRFERILKRAGWPMTRIGEPEQIGRTVAVAGMVGIRGHIQREGRSCMRLRAELFDRPAEHASVEPGILRRSQQCSLNILKGRRPRSSLLENAEPRRQNAIFATGASISVSAAVVHRMEHSHARRANLSGLDRNRFKLKPANKM